jgi:alpha-galactosidase
MLAIRLRTIILLFLITLSYSCNSPDQESGKDQEWRSYAPAPPMGWNSFDAYDSRINEAEFKANVDYLAENLKGAGYEYAVIDYIWWHPDPGNWDTPIRYGHSNIRYKSTGEPLHPEYITIDEYGRLLPAPERFPSAASGEGFKPIADYVHSKGLKFGIHIMRGIHMGTSYSARDIAEPFDTCGWNNHMFGVDASKPGAQEYYNSIFKLYAEWGVDFIKADDMLRPPYQKGEVELIQRAIINSGRPMILSLSPGEAPLSQAEHLRDHAHMWRISDDFWDEWRDLEHNFTLLNCWSPHTGPGHWPDADMIPFGRISLQNRPHGPERMTKFTWDEQITLLTLWSIARSPLMIGADLLTLPDSTLHLLTNLEVLAVNKNSIHNRQVTRRSARDGAENMRPGSVVWMAEDPGTGDAYLALFNLADEESGICFNLEWESLRGKFNIRDLWIQQDIGVIQGEVCASIPPHGAKLYRLRQVE